MSTLQDFLDAPIGATATLPGCPTVVKVTNLPTSNGNWHDGVVAWKPEGLATGGYQLDPSPAPATAREALALAWELAHPVKEGQVIPEGTRYFWRPGTGGLRPNTTMNEREADEREAKYMRTLDPLPDPEPDWTKAPAVIASHPIYADTEQKGIWIPSNEEGMWEWPFQQGEFMAHWTELENVTPLYPKEGKTHE